MPTPRQTIRIDEDMWLHFQKLCEQHGFNASQVIRAMIQEVIEGKIDIKDLQLGERLGRDAVNEALKTWLQRHLQQKTQ